MSISTQNARLKHTYLRGLGGRLATSLPNGRLKVEVFCSTPQCGEVGSFNCHGLFDAEQYDKRFVRKGWTLDPNVCPACKARKKEERKMTTQTKTAPAKATAVEAGTTGSLKAQRRMNELLLQHFDEDAGRYANGYSDQKVASETGLSLNVVTRYRTEAFGELKEPAELQALQHEIDGLQKRLDEEVQTIASLFGEEITKLRARLTELRQKYA